jgi:ketosteroid isomerase-like protein
MKLSRYLHNRRNILCGIFIYVLSTISFVATAQSIDEIAVRQVLKAQCMAWNKGDIDSYMKGYWNNDSLVFIGKNGPRYGYKTTVENYKKSYLDTAAMGKLTFDLLKLKQLSPRYYSVMGKWYLKRTVGDVAGYFTLLFKKINNKWFIIMDHSS